MAKYPNSYLPINVFYLFSTGSKQCRISHYGVGDLKMVLLL